jgi:hypothetical protein
MRSAFTLILLMIAPQQPTGRSSRSDLQSDALEYGPIYTAGGELKMPDRYREWIFLTSGVDMSYSPNAAMVGHSIFDNVFC